MSSPTNAEAAHPLDALPRASFAAIAFYASDKLRFFQFPESVCREGASQVIRASWPDGVQSESYHVGTAAYEYKLGGRPFGSTGEASGLAARVLVRNLLAYLHSLGWLLDNVAVAGARRGEQGHPHLPAAQGGEAILRWQRWARRRGGWLSPRPATTACAS